MSPQKGQYSGVHPRAMYWREWKRRSRREAKLKKRFSQQPPTRKIT